MGKTKDPDKFKTPFRKIYEPKFIRFKTRPGSIFYGLEWDGTNYDDVVYFCEKCEITCDYMNGAEYLKVNTKDKVIQLHLNELLIISDNGHIWKTESRFIDVNNQYIEEEKEKVVWKYYCSKEDFQKWAKEVIASHLIKESEKELEYKKYTLKNFVTDIEKLFKR